MFPKPPALETAAASSGPAAPASIADADAQLGGVKGSDAPGGWLTLTFPQGQVDHGAYSVDLFSALIVIFGAWVNCFSGMLIRSKRVQEPTA